MKNPVTYRQLDNMVLKTLNIDDTAIQPLIRQALFNNILYKLYALLNMVNHPWYERETDMTSGVSANTAFLTVGVISAIDATAKTITRAAGVWIVNSLLNIAIHNGSGVVLTQGVVHLDSLTSNDTVGHYTLLSGTIQTLGVNLCSVFVHLPYASSSFSIATLYVQEVQEISDEVGYAGLRMYNKITDPMHFHELTKDPRAADEIHWRQTGDTVTLYKGTAATAIGSAIVMSYRTKPALFTDANLDTSLDIPPEYNLVLFDMVAEQYAGAVQGTAIPDAITKRLQEFQSTYATEQGNAEVTKSEKGE